MYIALAKKPVTGMKDTIPAEVQIREYVMGQIKKTYKGFGFSQIEVPRVEHIENLTNKQGGDNEKFIFKILRRGDKLNLETISGENDLMNSGLHYDLTLPLSRYYASNAANLPSPFKVLQIGSVWHADRSQKGRLRRFVRCDIDILGDSTSLVEIELILVTTTTLSKICPDNALTARINDREILKGMALYCGFLEDSMGRMLAILDKMDRIGLEGVEKELLESGYQRECVNKYLDMLKNVARNADGVWALGQKLADVIPLGVSRNLAHIMDTVTEVSEADFSLEFDPTLARGVSYYAGVTFEVPMGGFGGSVAGGGRYDKMIGKLTGMETLACGFSIGFERIVTIPMDSGFKASGAGEERAYLFEEGVDSTTLASVIKEVTEKRKKDAHVLVAQMNKNKKFQKEQLRNEGCTEFKKFYRESLEK